MIKRYRFVKAIGATQLPFRYWLPYVLFGADFTF